MTIEEMKAFALDIMNRGPSLDTEKMTLAHSLYAFCEFYQRAKTELRSAGINLDESTLGFLEDDDLLQDLEGL